MSVAVFFICLSCAFASGCTEGFLLPARKRLSLPFTVLTDIGVGAMLVLPFAAVVFFLCDGRLFFYAAAAALLGFVAGAKTARAIVEKCVALRKKRAAKKIAKPQKTVV